MRSSHSAKQARRQLLILTLPLLAVMSACGGGHGGGGSSGSPTPAAAAPTVSVTPASATVTMAQPLTVNVQVAGSGAAPQGTVILTSGMFSAGSAPLASGAASFTVPAGVLPMGAQTLSVQYTPSAVSAASYTSASGSAAVTIATATAPSVATSYTTIPISGSPFQAIPVGSDVLISVADGMQTRIAVYNAVTPAELNFQCGQAAAQLGVTNAYAADGLTLFPNGLDLAVAVEGAGVDFLNATEATANCSSGQVVVGQVQTGQPMTGLGPGTFAVAVTQDGKYAFVANEYGVVANDSTGAVIEGNVSVVSLQYDATGHVSGGVVTGQFSTGGNAIANVTLSPDGARLYVTSEIAQPGGSVSGLANPTLGHNGCLQYAGGTPQMHGLLSVINVAKAEATPNASSIIATVAAGCAPVRVVETSDNQVIWVAARGDNAVLAFSTHMLESNPDMALLGSGSTGGVAPVGLQLFHNQQLLAVANSNRFSNPAGSGAPTVPGNLTVMNATPVNPTVLKTVQTTLFPRNVSVNADDSTLYLTDYTSQQLQVISTNVQ